MYSYLYLDYKNILWIHDYVLKVSWWLMGFINKEANSLIVDMVRSDIYYPAFADKIGYMLFGIAKSHEFADGNKRTALMSTAQFILLNTNDRDVTSQFIKEFENIVVRIADKKMNISKEMVIEYVEIFLWKYDQNESVLLRIYKELHSHNLV